MKLCSINGCSNVVLARGWCKKHYGRWQTHGDPLFVHSRLKGEPNPPVVSSRWIRNQQVFFTADDRAFVEIQKKWRDGSYRTQRRYGWVFVCETCKRESFSKSSGANRLRFCSHKCAGPFLRDSKLGRSKTLSKKNQIDTLDRMFSALVRSDGRCTNCLKTERLQCAHGFSRRYRSVRWNLQNAFCLCQGCHLFFTHRPLEWDDWLRKRWGSDLYSILRFQALSTEKVDLDAVRDSLVAELRRRDLTMHQLPKGASGWIGAAA